MIRVSGERLFTIASCDVVFGGEKLRVQIKAMAENRGTGVSWECESGAEKKGVVLLLNLSYNSIRKEMEN